MGLIRVYGDLANPDPRGRVVLHHAEDEITRKAELQDGLRVLVWDSELEAEGILEYSEGHWRARIDWETAIERETGEKLPERYWK